MKENWRKVITISLILEQGLSICVKYKTGYLELMQEQHLVHFIPLSTMNNLCREHITLRSYHPREDVTVHIVTSIIWMNMMLLTAIIFQGGRVAALPETSEGPVQGDVSSIMIPIEI